VDLASRRLFGFSIVYLVIVFAALLGDRLMAAATAGGGA
jgi:hypothetical protein